MRRRFGTLIGDSTAEKIKHEIGTAVTVKGEQEIDLRGRNFAEGIPKQPTEVKSNSRSAL